MYLVFPSVWDSFYAGIAEEVKVAVTASLKLSKDFTLVCLMCSDIPVNKSASMHTHAYIFMNRLFIYMNMYTNIYVCVCDTIC